MVSIPLLVFSTLFVTTLARIPINELDIKLYDDSSFETAIHEALNKAKELKEMSGTLSYASKAASLIPCASTAINGLSSIISSEGENVWKETLIQSIASETDRAIAVNILSDIKATMRTITGHFRTLNRGFLTDDSKRSIVHDINNDIGRIINIFTDGDSIFKRHPLLVIDSLSSLASIIGLFEPIVEALEPNFAQQLFLSCKMVNILREYRFLAVYRRIDLTGIWVQSSSGLYGAPSEPPSLQSRRTNVMDREYNSNGYAGTDSGYIECEKRGCDQSQHDRFCIKDLVTKEFFTAGDHRAVDNCAIGYLEVVRHRVEKAFEQPLELMQNSCPSDRSRRRTETGSGWLTLVINHAVAKYKYNSEKKCDPWYKENTDCEAYVKVLFDNREAFRSTTLHSVLKEWPNYYFYELFKSHKIQKSSNVKIEIWDEDSGPNDDLVLRGETNPTQLSTGVHKYSNGDNRLSVVGFWRNEYEDD